eukprot:987258-Rhodomonas_salina.1
MLRLSAYPYPTRSTARAATLGSWLEAELRMVCAVRSRRGLAAEAEASPAPRGRGQHRGQHQHQHRGQHQHQAEASTSTSSPAARP